MGGVGTAVQPSVAGSVRVLRPVRVRQVAAGLAVGAAAAASASLGLHLYSIRYFSDGEEYDSYIHTATGLENSGGGSDGASVAWIGPSIVAVALLAVAAVAALAAARTDRPGAWGAAAQHAALGAAGILAVLTAVVVVDAVSAVSGYGEGIVTRWGPAPFALGSAALLALAAGLTARRGRATVLATIGAEDTP